MELTTDQLEALSLGFHTHFTIGQGAANPLWDGFFFVVDSMHQAEDHVFSGGVPAMQKLSGNPVEKGLELFSQRITNETFYSLVGVPVEAMEDNNLGSFQQEMQMMGVRAANHPTKLFTQLLLNSFSENSYLGQPFISAAQPMEDGDTWSNRVTGALSAASFETAERQMDEAQDYQGEDWEGDTLGGDLVLIVPPALRSTAEGIVGVERNANGSSNQHWKKAEVLVLPGLRTQPTWWWLARRNSVAMPFLLQRRTEPEWIVESETAGQAMLKGNRFRYGVRRRHAVGFGHPQQIQGGRP